MTSKKQMRKEILREMDFASTDIKRLCAELENKNDKNREKQIMWLQIESLAMLKQIERLKAHN